MKWIGYNYECIVEVAVFWATPALKTKNLKRATYITITYLILSSKRNVALLSKFIFLRVNLSTPN